MPYPNPNNSSANGYSPLPDGWTVSIVNGQYTIAYNNQPVQQSNLSGTMLANSVTTGVGSFHLGQAHAIGSAGQNVTFKNNQTNVCWFPVWQGQSADGTTIYNPQARTFQAQQTLKLNGEVNLSGAPVPYMVTDTMTGNLSFTRISLYPSENYAGVLTWTVTYTPSGIQVANVQVTGCASGTLLTIPLEYPLDARTGDSFTVTITKEDGSKLNAYPGTTRPAEAYRGLVCRPFTDSIVWNQSNIGTGLKVSGLNLAVDPAQIDATQLLNISQVSSGGYVGAINFAGGLAQFANAQKNQYWQANTAGTIGGLTFAVGDNLICVTSITGTPATLNNSSWSIRANVSAIASSTQLGQVKPTDGLSIDSSGTLTTKLGTGLAYDGTKAITINPAQIDVTTLNKADTLVNGIYKGGLNATSTLATLTNAVKGNWWNVSAAVTISGTAFGVGDQLWCQTAVTGVPVDLTNFTRVPATMAQATTTATGTIQLAGDLGGTAAAPIVSKMGGATVPASSPTASGQYHRSSSTSATAWSSIQASDLPAASSSTQGAVKVGGVTPQALGNTASAGTSTVSAAADHVHPIPTFTVNMGLVSDGNGRTTASATTAAEIAVLSGATASQTPIITDTDAVVFNDGGVMKQLRVDTLSNYVKSAYTAGGLTPYMTQKLPQDKILASDTNGDMQALNITPATLATFVGQNASSKQTRQATTYTYIAFQALRGLLFKFNIAQSSTNLVVSSTSGDTLRYVVRYGHQSLNPIISTATFSQNTEFMTLGTSSGRGWFVDGMVYSTTDESKYLRFSLIAVDETATLQYINCQIW